jgi:hypothetical protein
MKKISLKVLTLTAVLASAGLVIADTSSNETTLSQIAGYRQWTRVNPQPVMVVDDSAASAI